MLSRAAKSIVQTLHQRGYRARATNFRTITGPGGPFYQTQRGFKQSRLRSACDAGPFKNSKFHNTVTERKVVSANDRTAIMNGVTAGGGTPVFDTSQVRTLGAPLSENEPILLKARSAIHTIANRNFSRDTRKSLFVNTTRSYTCGGKREPPAAKCPKESEKQVVSPCKQRGSCIPEAQKCGCTLEPKCPAPCPPPAPKCPPPCPAPPPPCPPPCPPPKPKCPPPCPKPKCATTCSPPAPKCPPSKPKCPTPCPPPKPKCPPPCPPPKPKCPAPCPPPKAKCPSACPAAKPKCPAPPPPCPAPKKCEPDKCPPPPAPKCPERQPVICFPPGPPCPKPCRPPKCPPRCPLDPPSGPIPRQETKVCQPKPEPPNCPPDPPRCQPPPPAKCPPDPPKCPPKWPIASRFPPEPAKCGPKCPPPCPPPPPKCPPPCPSKDTCGSPKKSCEVPVGKVTSCKPACPAPMPECVPPEKRTPPCPTCGGPKMPCPPQPPCPKQSPCGQEKPKEPSPCSNPGNNPKSADTAVNPNPGNKSVNKPAKKKKRGFWSSLFGRKMSTYHKNRNVLSYKTYRPRYTIYSRTFGITACRKSDKCKEVLEVCKVSTENCSKPCKTKAAAPNAQSKKPNCPTCLPPKPCQPLVKPGSLGKMTYKDNGCPKTEPCPSYKDKIGPIAKNVCPPPPKLPGPPTMPVVLCRCPPHPKLDSGPCPCLKDQITLTVPVYLPPCTRKSTYTCKKRINYHCPPKAKCKLETCEDRN